uniref:Uncharacterized protein n=2 Tax=Salix viminalis TaxID=40686 RepID=A0A6N2LE33_SALVM
MEKAVETQRRSRGLIKRVLSLKEDYDLCSICFAAMGNEADFIKMDRPMSLEVRHFDLLPEKGFEVDLDAIAALADQNSEQLQFHFPQAPTYHWKLSLALLLFLMISIVNWG